MIIGDGACGKTSLLSVFTLGYFPTVSSQQLLEMELMADLLFYRSIMLVLAMPSPRNHMSDFRLLGADSI